MIYYNLGEGVEAFSTNRGDSLPYNVIQGHQVHDDRIAVITSPLTTRDDLEGYDAFITSLPGCAIGARTADCVPILLYDSKRRVVAAVHSGWKGTVKRISQKTIRKLISDFDTNPSDLRAVIGPSISVDAFEVGEEVVSAFLNANFPNDIVVREGYIKPHIDLWKANRWLLEEMGVRPENIHVEGICSYANHDVLNSARWEHNSKTDRTINAICLL